MARRLLTPALIACTLGLSAIACGEPDKDDTAAPEGDTDTDTDADTDTDTDTDTDADTDTDTDADTDADTDIQVFDEDWFDFREQHFPMPEGSVFCSANQGQYVIRGGALSDTTGIQANIYAYFPGEEPPEPGAYIVDDDVTAPLEQGETHLMVLDISDTSFWYGAADEIYVLDYEGAMVVRWDDNTLWNGTPDGPTTQTNAQMTCP